MKILSINLKIKFKKITIIRNPLERVVSQYKFTIFKKKISLNEYKLETFLKEQKDNYQDNIIIRILANIYNMEIKVNNEHVDEAEKNIKKFWFYLDFQYWDLFLKMLISFMGMPNILYTKMQSHNYEFSYKPEQKDLDLIKKYNEFDCFFYEKIFKSQNPNINLKKYINNDIKIDEYLLVIPEKIENTKNYLYSKFLLNKLFKINL